MLWQRTGIIIRLKGILIIGSANTVHHSGLMVPDANDAFEWAMKNKTFDPSGRSSGFDQFSEIRRGL